MENALKPQVGLLVTCLVDLFRPKVAFATIKLLEEMQCVVIVPEQTCCGQPAFNNGDRKDTEILAQRVICTFENFDYLVVPSGSCAGTIHKHYPELFKDNSEWSKRANNLAKKTYELTSFLVDVLHMKTVSANFSGVVTYHDSCSSLRELGIYEQPRKLLKSIPNLHLQELSENEVCCGFGGTFCVKYPDISNKMVSDKVVHIEASGAKTLLAGDLGCLMNISGKLKRLCSDIKVLHVAEMLANMAEEGIGDPA